MRGKKRSEKNRNCLHHDAFFSAVSVHFPLKNQWHLQEMFNSERRLMDGWMDGCVIVPLLYFLLSVQVFFHAVVPHPLPLWTPDKHPGDHHGHSHVKGPPLRPWQDGLLPALDLLLPPVSLTATPHSGTSLLQTLVFTIY